MVDSSRPKPFRAASVRPRAETPALRRASLRELRAAPDPASCSICGGRLAEGGRSTEGLGGGAVDGSLAWSRGERTELERVRQCEPCATGLASTMLRRFDDEDDGG